MELWFCLEMGLPQFMTTLRMAKPVVNIDKPWDSVCSPLKNRWVPPPLCLSQIPERPHAVMLPHACGRCNLSWQTRRIRRAGESQRSHPPPRRSVAPRLQKCPR